jgi:hypothetical protein
MCVRCRTVSSCSLWILDGTRWTVYRSVAEEHSEGTMWPKFWWRDLKDDDRAAFLHLSSLSQKKRRACQPVMPACVTSKMNVYYICIWSLDFTTLFTYYIFIMSCIQHKNFCSWTSKNTIFIYEELHFSNPKQHVLASQKMVRGCQFWALLNTQWK